MFLLTRFVIALGAGFVWKWTRQSAWWIKNLPWIRIVSLLTAVALLISIVLDVVIKIQRIRSDPGATP